MKHELAVQQGAITRSRMGYIGGSDVAAIIGVSPFGTAYDLWLEKTGKPLDRERTQAQADALYFGKLLEPVILQALGDKHGIYAENINRIYVDGENDWMRAEIDFEYLDARGIICNGDCKSVNAFARHGWGEEDTDELPDYYVAQFLWGQARSERDYTCVAALFGGSQLRKYGVERDQETIDFLNERADYFWHRHVLADVPPPAQSREDAQRLVAKIPGFRWVVDENTRADITYLQELNKQKMRAEKAIEAAEEKLLTAFSGQALLYPDQKAEGFTMTDSQGRKIATWNRQSATRIDQSILKSEHPAIAAKCTKTSIFHVLRIPKEKV